MKIKSIRKIENSSKLYDIQTTTNNFFANCILVHNSMIRPIPTPEGFRLATKSGITEYSMSAEEFISDKPHYSTFIKKCIQKGTTPIFEWITPNPKQRVVLHYPEDDLILTGVRYNTQGTYLNYKDMFEYASAYNIPVVKVVNGLSVQNIKLFITQVREWEGTEGVVARFDSGYMCKVKSDDYCLRHKSKDSINQEKNVIETIIMDSVDDIVPLLTEEDANRLKSFKDAFWLSVEDVASGIYDTYKSIERGQDQKEFAQIVTSKIPKKLQSYMFNLRRGEPARDLLVKSISKSLSTQTKVDENRWMFGGLQWN